MVEVSTDLQNNVLAQPTTIPSWIKNTAKLWGEGQISDSEFINAIQWLIDQKILTTQSIVKSDLSQTMQNMTSIQDLLPKENEIGNEWQASKILYGKNSYNDTIHYDNTVVTQNYTKISNNDKILVALYDFGFPDRAMNWNDQLVSTFQGAKFAIGSSVDGSIQDMCKIEEKTETNSPAYYTSIMFCHHGNFQFVVMGKNNTISEENMNKFAEIILNKIWYVVNVNTTK